MLNDVDFSVVYASGEREPAEFFLDALINSTKFDFALGFFSTSGFRALALGFAYFIVNGGTMRIIINNILSSEDKEAIQRGQYASPEELVEEQLTRNIEDLYDSLSRYDKHFFDCISWLIASKRVEIIAVTPSSNAFGIAHHKFGIFQDMNNNITAFNGSSNFSNTALFQNLEALSCYRSWTNDQSDIDRINYFRSSFDQIWDGSSNNVQRVSIEKVKILITDRFPVKDISELLQGEAELIDLMGTSDLTGLNDNTGIQLYKKKLYELKARLLYLPEESGPHLPLGVIPRDYQLQALQNWQQSDCVGFFEMATGTGKTITALNCALELYKEEGSIRVIVLVPTLPLANQWKEEAEKFNFSNVVVANSKQPKWAQQILRLLNLSFTQDLSFIVIATYATFATERFQSIVSKLKSDTLIIADEAHNFGTERHIKNFPHNLKRRIGLSATHKRHFDKEGTESVMRFFNAERDVTFRLDMEEAIERGFLCKYYYYPRIVTLTEEELQRYKEISKKLFKFYDPRTGRFIDNKAVTMLLLQRKRVIDKATEKINCLRKILEELTEHHKPLKYTFVYVPEGKPDVFDDDDQRLINDYSRVINKEFGLKQHQFIGTTSDRSVILQKFADGYINVLTAMKCLDEGVDIKRAEIAIFSASTSNPRQFIQRRGRILRTHPDKSFASVYDMIVAPDINIHSYDESLSMERSIMLRELNRVSEFASMAINKYAALDSLRDAAERYGIDIFLEEVALYSGDQA